MTPKPGKLSSRLHALVREARQTILSEKSSDPSVLAKVIQAADPVQDINTLSVASTYSLALWCLHGKHSGDGYGFPFDRPLLSFAQRLLELDLLLPELLKLFLSGDYRDNQLLPKLTREVSDIAKDLKLCQAVEELRWRSQVFDRLRKAMRIASSDHLCFYYEKLGDDWFIENKDRTQGTTVQMQISLYATHTEEEIFNMYTAKNADHNFSKTQ